MGTIDRHATKRGRGIDCQESNTALGIRIVAGEHEGGALSLLEHSVVGSKLDAPTDRPATARIREEEICEGVERRVGRPKNRSIRTFEGVCEQFGIGATATCGHYITPAQVDTNRLSAGI